MSFNVDVMCMSCGSTKNMTKLSSSARCACGSDDLDLYDPIAYRAAFVQTPVHQAPQTVDAWNEYAGPAPGRNDQSNGIPTPLICPVCHGKGYDPTDGFGGQCRACSATGYITPVTNVAPPMVARHDYPSNQTQVPFMGTPGQETTTPTLVDSAQQERDRRKISASQDSSFALTGAACPTCDQQKLALRQDNNDDAITICANCGPLLNLDRRPEIDPWNFPHDFVPERAGRLRQAFRKLVAGGAEGKTGRLFAIAAMVSQHNNGLTAREVVEIARNTISEY